MLKLNPLNVNCNRFWIGYHIKHHNWSMSNLCRNFNTWLFCKNKMWLRNAEVKRFRFYSQGDVRYVRSVV